MSPRQLDHIPQPVFRVYGFGQNYIGPGDGVHYSKAVKYLRQRRRYKDSTDDLKLARAQGQRRLNKLFRHQTNRADDNREQIHKDAKEQERNLLLFVYSKPE